MADADTLLPVGQRVYLPRYTGRLVVLEAAHPFAKGCECRVRLPDGTLDEAVRTQEEIPTNAIEQATQKG